MSIRETEQIIDNSVNDYLFHKVVVLKSELETVLQQEHIEEEDIVERCRDINSYVDF